MILVISNFDKLFLPPPVRSRQKITVYKNIDEADTKRDTNCSTDLDTCLYAGFGNAENLFKLRIEHGTRLNKIGY